MHHHSALDWTIQGRFLRCSQGQGYAASDRCDGWHRKPFCALFRRRYLITIILHPFSFVS
jgi:hypothetical protein